MKTLIAAIIISGSFCAAASAASCRASTAALAGAQAGYAQAQQAAESWAQRQKQASNRFQQCLGEISTSVTVPVFPDISDLLDKIKDQICSAARDKIHDYLPGTIDPWGDLGVNLPTTSVPIKSRAVSRSSVRQSSPAPQSTSVPRASSSGASPDYPFSL
ncbi:hypothetical protein FCZ59_20540 [Escherichia coli]|nr:hypothetical protein [Escherichia coli]